MTVTTMAALFVGQRVGFRDLIAVRESIESVDSPRNILRLLLQIARITFAVELLAAVALSVAFIRRGMAPSESIFQGVFHAIMSFCNAGLVNLENGSLRSTVPNVISTKKPTTISRGVESLLNNTFSRIVATQGSRTGAADPGQYTREPGYVGSREPEGQKKIQSGAQ